MKTKYQAIFDELQNELELLISSNENPALHAEDAIKMIDSDVCLVNDLICSYEFPTKEEEILFFKTTKPKYLSLLLYYNCIYKLESSKPDCSKRELKKYLTAQRMVLSCFADENREFYKYYKTGSTCYA